MNIVSVSALQKIPAAKWDFLSGSRDPFLSHGVLAGMEMHGCLEGHGWYPAHLLAYENSELVGALPLYLRDNSYGEFVFDWAWAEAYQRAGGRYYPKLVSAVPFTPVSGPRLLVAETYSDTDAIAQALISVALETAREHALSSWHCLFPSAEQLPFFSHPELIVREGCQYHWINQGYASFDDFLATLNSKRRKEIRRERREFVDLNLQFEVLEGSAITAKHWAVFYKFYCDTFDRKWGSPRLTEAYFNHLSENNFPTPVLFLAKDGNDYVAGAFALRGPDTLYGRHWGCRGYIKNLHFELCYYRTIEYCIEHGLTRLDAGAQGEHKIPRGFTSQKTWSLHWIRDPGFRRAVADFCRREQGHIADHIEAVDAHSAYRIAHEPS
ncbi:MAG: GNAT family N-acetyltransferase [Gammaproteobacteria bacterium]|nr:GNAT family N-acetyltransferase [Gammaproteobacteria bacterium]